MKSGTKGMILVAVLLLAMFIFGFYWMYTSSTPEGSYSDLIADMQEGKVASISISDDTATIKLSDGYKYKKSSTYKVFVRDTVLLEKIDKIYEGKQLPKIVLNNRYGVDVWNVISTVLMVGVGLLVLIMLFRAIGSSNRQAMDFSKSSATAQRDLKVRFTDVAGADEEKEELQEIVEFLKNPQKFSAVGARIPRGVLLVGPPGTGKTLLAKAVSGEASVPFFSISGSDFVEMYVGVGASRVRSLFDTAKKNSPCIIFIDEIDAVGRQRGAGLGGGHDEREQTLNQLLVQMDGFQTNNDIIVMAATNRSDVLDPALLRPGRFDRQIHVNLPDVRGREAIFKVHARNKPISSEIDFKILARMTSGFSGADISNLLNEAAILCARKGRKEIVMQDIYEGINKVLIGPQKKSRLVTEVDKRITAYHEAGHAIVAKVNPHCHPVHEVSIISRGGAAGYTMTRPEDDNDHMRYNHLVGTLAMTFGGRAAEEIVIKDITTGAQADIRQATSIARKMVTEWGMSDLGPVFYGTSHEVFLGRDYGASHSYSDDMASKIDGEVNKIISKAHDEALRILTENRSKLDVMARVLIECETIYAEEVEMIMQGHTAEEVKKALEERLASQKKSSKTEVTANRPTEDNKN